VSTYIGASLVNTAAASLCLYLCVCLSVTAVAQPPPPAPAPVEALPSPEVHPDGRVTFRLHAPRASEVTVAGEWTRPQPNTPQKMTRDEQGTWSITVGPLEPNIYIYVFNLDGLTLPDPVNPIIKLRARGSASMVEVPGGRPWEFRDVPHGALQIRTHASRVLGGAMRQVFIYTPPGYDRSSAARYPVLYLLHGTNDLAAGWTMAGRANLILDNLISEKKAVPMIVVMPWGHALPFGARPAAGQPSNADVFERYLIEEVMPLVAGSLRVAPGRRQRAIVGLSMGGAQALQIALAHRDLFGSLGIFGSGMTRADFDTHYKDLRATPALDMLLVGVAKDDGARGRARELVEALRAHGFDPAHVEIEGGHTYPSWRTLLAETATRLFHKP
jgi:enterochelin esterase-like enzyme